MKKEWHFLEKILAGQKTVESRWYLYRRSPWNGITGGDTIIFKQQDEMARVEVKKALQFQGLNQEKIREILEKYGLRLGIENTKKFFASVKGKKYCILIFLKNPKKIRPFAVNKKGFGQMASWISVHNITSIKV